MVQRKTYTLKKLLKNRGVYSSIDFEIQSNENKQKILIFEYNADDRWKIMCEAGALIFFDYYSRKKEGELKVIINKVDWMPVDTNNIIILYSVIKGMADILNFNIEGLEINENTESFIIPELRVL